MKFIPEFIRRAPFCASLLGLLCLVCNSLCAKAASTSQEVQYRTVSSVLSLPYDVAKQGGVARIEGTVILSNTLGLIVHDRTGGIWVDTRGNYTPGDRLVVTGVVDPGKYSPQITWPNVQLIGRGDLPRAVSVSYDKLSSGLEDSQYVSVEGTVVSVGQRSDLDALGQVTLWIAMGEGRVEAILAPSLAAKARALIGAKVQVVATVFSRKNDNMQVTGVVLAVSDSGAIHVLEPGPKNLFAVAAQPIGNLLRYRSNTDYFHRVRISGVLTYYEPGRRIILQDGSDAIEIFSPELMPLKVGDRVEAVGFPAPDASGPVLQDAALRFLAHGSPPSPRPVALRDALSSKYRFCLISLEMRLLRVIDEPSRRLLLLEHNNNITTAELPSRGNTPANTLVAGSMVRVSGINLLTGQPGLVYYRSAIQSTLLLRASSDITVLSPAPWWTKSRLSYLAAILGVLLAGLFALLARLQLKRWKMETVLQERERLASDVHDTLAQSFAGIGFQLQVLRKAIQAGDPQIGYHLSVAGDLVRFSHREARKSFALVSTDEDSNGDLLASLRTTADGLDTAGTVVVHVSSSGPVRPIPAAINKRFIRIGQEAISNAIHHAEPAHLTVTVAYTADSVRLDVVDDGRGFVMRGDLLGFGIRSMRKHAGEIGGDLTITSHPGQGTTVSVVVDLPSKPGRISSSWTRIRSLAKKVMEQRTYVRG